MFRGRSLRFRTSDWRNLADLGSRGLPVQPAPVLALNVAKPEFLGELPR